MRTYFGLTVLGWCLVGCLASWAGVIYLLASHL